MRNLDRVVNRVFPPGAALLHAGCGSGQVDANLQRVMRITALDISPAALRLYARNNPRAEQIMHGSIFALPFPDASFDGVYNLGVMEHFTREEIGRILGEFHRVLKPAGKIVIFWPHRRATSVFALRTAHFLLNTVMNSRQAPPAGDLPAAQSAAAAAVLAERASRCSTIGSTSPLLRPGDRRRRARGMMAEAQPEQAAPVRRRHRLDFLIGALTLLSHGFILTNADDLGQLVRAQFPPDPQLVDHARFLQLRRHAALRLAVPSVRARAGRRRGLHGGDVPLPAGQRHPIYLLAQRPAS